MQQISGERLQDRWSSGFLCNKTETAQQSTFVLATLGWESRVSMKAVYVGTSGEFCPLKLRSHKYKCTGFATNQAESDQKHVHITGFTLYYQ